MADNKEMQLEYNFFADVWKLYKEYYNPVENEEYWSDLMSAAHEIEHKYNNELCKDLLLSVINDLDRKHKQNGT
jgi:hypothetical protein